MYAGRRLVGALVALYYWRKPEARQYAEEVAEELSKVTLAEPQRSHELHHVVIVTTVVRDRVSSRYGPVLGLHHRPGVSELTMT